jgi:hypothetical protein
MGIFRFADLDSIGSVMNRCTAAYGDVQSGPIGI